jgi:hypothetical protein
MSATDPTSAERSQRHRLRLAERLDQIQAELAERSARIERQLAALRIRLDLADPEQRQQGQGR